MKKFTATAIDLDLELITLSKETVKLEGPKKINTDQATAILKEIEKADERIKKNPTATGAMKEAIGFVIDVYGKDEAFWTGNFNPALIMEIRKWFVSELAGLKKKD